MRKGLADLFNTFFNLPHFQPKPTSLTKGNSIVILWQKVIGVENSTWLLTSEFLSLEASGYRRQMTPY